MTNWNMLKKENEDLTNEVVKELDDLQINLIEMESNLKDMVAGMNNLLSSNDKETC